MTKLTWTTIIHMVLIVAVLVFCVSNASADTLLGQDKIYDSTTKEVTLKNNFLGLFPTTDIAKIKLVNYTGYCWANDCWVYYHLNNFEDGMITLSDTKYYTKSGDNLNERTTEYQIWDDAASYEIPIYKEVCKNVEVNKTLINECHNEEIGKETRYGQWIVFNSTDKFVKGEYQLKQKVDVNEGETVDIVPKFYDFWIDEWADMTGLTKIEWQNTGNANADYWVLDQGVTNSYPWQTFTIGTTGLNQSWIIQGVSIHTGDAYARVGNWTIAVYPANVSGNGCNFTATPIAYKVMLNYVEPTVENIWINYTFNSFNGTMVAGQMGCLYLNGTPLQANGPWIRDNRSNPYAGGNSGDNSGADATWDIGFEIWGTAAPVDNPPSVALLTPADSYNITTHTIYFAMNASDDNNVTNFTLFINGIKNITQTNGTTSSIFNQTMNIGDGAYSWMGCASDDISQYTCSANRTFNIDSTKPIPMILIPTNQSYNVNVSWMNFSVSDTHLQACWYSNNNTQNATVTCGNNATGMTSAEGSNVWLFGANDSFGNQNTTFVTFFKDTIAPEIKMIYPENVTYDYNLFTLNYTISDANLESCWYSTNEGTNNISLTCGTNASGLTASEGSNTWQVWANDTSGNENKSEILFDVDTLPPIINILYPLNQSYNVAVDEINYSITHLTGTLDSCMYSRTGTGNFTAVPAGENFTGVTTVEGSNQIIISCNDTANNWGYADIWFFRDTVFPQLMFYPSLAYINPDGTIIPYTLFAAIANATDDNLQNITVRIYDSISTLVANWFCPTTEVNAVCGDPNVLGNGLYYYNATACDTSNNCNNSATRNVTLDTIAPELNLQYPNNITYSSLITLMNYSTNDSNFDSCWYSTDSGITNISIPCGTTDEYLTWSNIELMDNTTIDIGTSTEMCPFSYESEHQLYQTFNITMPEFSVGFNLTKVGIYVEKKDGTPDDSCWMLETTGGTNIAVSENLSLTESTFTNYTFAGDAIVSQSGIYRMRHCENTGNGNNLYWTNLTATNEYSRGTAGQTGVATCTTAGKDVPMWFYGKLTNELNYISGLTGSEGSNSGDIWTNDSAGNTNHTSITFFQDTVYPEINIVYPTNSTYNHLLLDLNFTINDLNLYKCWYSIDDGTTNTTITCGDNTTQIASQGSNIWLVGVNDTSGNSNMSRIIFTADTIFPLISISKPDINYIHAQELGAIYLNFTITDTNLASIWFSINNGGGNTTLYATTTEENSTTFTAIEGDAIVKLWANDSAGNLNYTTVNYTVVNITVGDKYVADIMIGTTQNYNSTINKSSSVKVDASKFTYNNTDYYDALNISNLFYKILIPPVENNLNYTKVLYWTYNFSYKGYNLSIEGPQHNQTISDFYIEICGGSTNVTSLNYTGYVEATIDEINHSIEYYFNYTTVNSTVYHILNGSEITNNLSRHSFCIFPNDTILVTGLISYYVTGYDRRELFYNNYSIDDTNKDIPLYLLATNASDIFKFLVIDENDNPVEGAYIYVQRQDIPSNIYNTVGVVSTGSDGTGIINMRLNDAWYRQQVVYNGEIYLTTSAAKESGTSKTLRIFFTQINPYLSFNTLSYTLINTSNGFLFTYADPTPITNTCCLIVEATNSTLFSFNKLNTSCTTSPSSTMTFTIPSNGSYIAYAQCNLTTGESKILDTISNQWGKEARFEVMQGFGRVAAFILIGTCAMVGVYAGSILLGGGLVVISVVMVNLFGLVSFTMSTIYMIIALVVMIAITSNRK